MRLRIVLLSICLLFVSGYRVGGIESLNDKFGLNMAGITQFWLGFGYIDTKSSLISCYAEDTVHIKCLCSVGVSSTPIITRAFSKYSTLKIETVSFSLPESMQLSATEFLQSVIIQSNLKGYGAIRPSINDLIGTKTVAVFVKIYRSSTTMNYYVRVWTPNIFNVRDVGSKEIEIHRQNSPDPIELSVASLRCSSFQSMDFYTNIVCAIYSEPEEQLHFVIYDVGSDSLEQFVVKVPADFDELSFLNVVYENNVQILIAQGSINLYIPNFPENRDIETVAVINEVFNLHSNFIPIVLDSSRVRDYILYSGRNEQFNRLYLTAENTGIDLDSTGYDVMIDVFEIKKSNDFTVVSISRMSGDAILVYNSHDYSLNTTFDASSSTSMCLKSNNNLYYIAEDVNYEINCMHVVDLNENALVYTACDPSYRFYDVSCTADNIYFSTQDTISLRKLACSMTGEIDYHCPFMADQTESDFTLALTKTLLLVYTDDELRGYSEIRSSHYRVIDTINNFSDAAILKTFPMTNAIGWYVLYERGKNSIYWGTYNETVGFEDCSDIITHSVHDIIIVNNRMIISFDEKDKVQVLIYDRISNTWIHEGFVSFDMLINYNFGGSMILSGNTLLFTGIASQFIENDLIYYHTLDIVCEDNHVLNEYMQCVLVCDEGAIFIPATDTCVQCESGMYAYEDFCLTCLSGHFCVNGIKTICPNGMVAGKGSISCVACDSQSAPNSERSSCVKNFVSCPSNFVVAFSLSVQGDICLFDIGKDDKKFLSSTDNVYISDNLVIDHAISSKGVRYISGSIYIENGELKTGKGFQSILINDFTCINGTFTSLSMKIKGSLILLNCSFSVIDLIVERDVEIANSSVRVFHKVFFYHHTIYVSNTHITSVAVLFGHFSIARLTDVTVEGSIIMFKAAQLVVQNCSSTSLSADVHSSIKGELLVKTLFTTALPTFSLPVLDLMSFQRFNRSAVTVSHPTAPICNYDDALELVGLSGVVTSSFNNDSVYSLSVAEKSEYKLEGFEYSWTEEKVERLEFDTSRTRAFLCEELIEFFGSKDVIEFDDCGFFEFVIRSISIKLLSLKNEYILDTSIDGSVIIGSGVSIQSLAVSDGTLCFENEIIFDSNSLIVLNSAILRFEKLLSINLPISHIDMSEISCKPGQYVSIDELSILNQATIVNCVFNETVIIHLEGSLKLNDVTISAQVYATSGGISVTYGNVSVEWVFRNGNNIALNGKMYSNYFDGYHDRFMGNYELIFIDNAAKISIIVCYEHFINFTFKNLVETKGTNCNFTCINCMFEQDFNIYSSDTVHIYSSTFTNLITEELTEILWGGDNHIEGLSITNSDTIFMEQPHVLTKLIIDTLLTNNAPVRIGPLHTLNIENLKMNANTTFIVQNLFLTEVILVTSQNFVIIGNLHKLDRLIRGEMGSNGVSITVTAVLTKIDSLLISDLVVLWSSASIIDSMVLSGSNFTISNSLQVNNIHFNNSFFVVDGDYIQLHILSGIFIENYIPYTIDHPSTEYLIQIRSNAKSAVSINGVVSAKDIPDHVPFITSSKTVIISLELSEKLLPNMFVLNAEHSDTKFFFTKFLSYSASTSTESYANTFYAPFAAGLTDIHGDSIGVSQNFQKNCYKLEEKLCIDPISILAEGSTAQDIVILLNDTSKPFSFEIGDHTTAVRVIVGRNVTVDFTYTSQSATPFIVFAEWNSSVTIFSNDDYSTKINMFGVNTELLLKNTAKMLAYIFMDGVLSASNTKFVRLRIFGSHSYVLSSDTLKIYDSNPSIIGKRGTELSILASDMTFVLGCFDYDNEFIITLTYTTGSHPKFKTINTALSLNSVGSEDAYDTSLSIISATAVGYFKEIKAQSISTIAISGFKTMYLHSRVEITNCTVHFYNTLMYMNSYSGLLLTDSVMEYFNQVDSLTFGYIYIEESFIISNSDEFVFRVNYSETTSLLSRTLQIYSRNIIFTHNNNITHSAFSADDSIILRFIVIDFRLFSIDLNITNTQIIGSKSFFSISNGKLRYLQDEFAFNVDNILLCSTHFPRNLEIINSSIGINFACYENIGWVTVLTEQYEHTVFENVTRGGSPANYITFLTQTSSIELIGDQNTFVHAIFEGTVNGTVVLRDSLSVLRFIQVLNITTMEFTNIYFPGNPVHMFVDKQRSYLSGLFYLQSISDSWTCLTALRDDAAGIWHSDNVLGASNPQYTVVFHPKSTSLFSGDVIDKYLILSEKSNIWILDTRNFNYTEKNFRFCHSCLLSKFGEGDLWISSKIFFNKACNVSSDTNSIFAINIHTEFVLNCFNVRKIVINQLNCTNNLLIEVDLAVKLMFNDSNCDISIPFGTIYVYSFNIVAFEFQILTPNEFTYKIYGSIYILRKVDTQASITNYLLNTDICVYCIDDQFRTTFLAEKQNRSKAIDVIAINSAIMFGFEPASSSRLNIYSFNSTIVFLRIEPGELLIDTLVAVNSHITFKDLAGSELLFKLSNAYMLDSELKLGSTLTFEHLVAEKCNITEFPSADNVSIHIFDPVNNVGFNFNTFDNSNIYLFGENHKYVSIKASNSTIYAITGHSLTSNFRFNIGNESTLICFDGEIIVDTNTSVYSFGKVTYYNLEKHESNTLVLMSDSSGVIGDAVDINFDTSAYIYLDEYTNYNDVHSSLLPLLFIDESYSYIHYSRYTMLHLILSYVPLISYRPDIIISFEDVASKGCLKSANTRNERDQVELLLLDPFGPFFNLYTCNSYVLLDCSVSISCSGLNLNEDFVKFRVTMNGAEFDEESFSSITKSNETIHIDIMFPITDTSIDIHLLIEDDVLDTSTSILSFKETEISTSYPTPFSTDSYVTVTFQCLTLDFNSKLHHTLINGFKDHSIIELVSNQILVSNISLLGIQDNILKLNIGEVTFVSNFTLKASIQQTLIVSYNTNISIQGSMLWIENNAYDVVVFDGKKLTCEPFEFGLECINHDLCFDKKYTFHIVFNGEVYASVSYQFPMPMEIHGFKHEGMTFSHMGYALTCFSVLTPDERLFQIDDLIYNHENLTVSAKQMVPDAYVYFNSTTPLLLQSHGTSVNSIDTLSASTSSFELIINGNHLGGHGTVYFIRVTVGQYDCSIRAVTHNEIICVLTGIGVDHHITLGVGSYSQIIPFKVSFDRPIIKYMTPSVTSCAVPTNVTVHGSNFGSERISFTIYLPDDTSLIIEKQSASHIMFFIELPADPTGSCSGMGGLQATVGGQSSNTLLFNYAVVGSVTPSIIPAAETTTMLTLDVSNAYAEPVLVLVDDDVSIEITCTYTSYRVTCSTVLNEPRTYTPFLCDGTTELDECEEPSGSVTVFGVEQDRLLTVGSNSEARARFTLVNVDFDFDLRNIDWISTPVVSSLLIEGSVADPYSAVFDYGAGQLPLEPQLLSVGIILQDELVVSGDRFVVSSDYPLDQVSVTLNGTNIYCTSRVVDSTTLHDCVANVDPGDYVVRYTSTEITTSVGLLSVYTVTGIEPQTVFSDTPFEVIITGYNLPEVDDPFCQWTVSHVSCISTGISDAQTVVFDWISTPITVDPFPVLDLPTFAYVNTSYDISCSENCDFLVNNTVYTTTTGDKPLVACNNAHCAVFSSITISEPVITSISPLTVSVTSIRPITVAGQSFKPSCICDISGERETTVVDDSTIICDVPTDVNVYGVNIVCNGIASNTEYFQVSPVLSPYCLAGIPTSLGPIFNAQSVASVRESRCMLQPSDPVKKSSFEFDGATDTVVDGVLVSYFDTCNVPSVNISIGDVSLIVNSDATCDRLPSFATTHRVCAYKVDMFVVSPGMIVDVSVIDGCDATSINSIDLVELQLLQPVSVAITHPTTVRANPGDVPISISVSNIVGETFIHDYVIDYCHVSYFNFLHEVSVPLCRSISEILTVSVFDSFSNTTLQASANIEPTLGDIFDLSFSHTVIELLGSEKEHMLQYNATDWLGRDVELLSLTSNGTCNNTLPIITSHIALRASYADLKDCNLCYNGICSTILTSITPYIHRSYRMIMPKNMDSGVVKILPINLPNIDLDSLPSSLNVIISDLIFVSYEYTFNHTTVDIFTDRLPYPPGTVVTYQIVMEQEVVHTDSVTLSCQNSTTWNFARASCVCNAGFRSVQDDPLICASCGAGFYQPSSGMSFCQTCSATYTSQPGATAYTDCFCPNGTEEIEGICVECPIGYLCLNGTIKGVLHGFYMGQSVIPCVDASSCIEKDSLISSNCAIDRYGYLCHFCSSNRVSRYSECDPVNISQFFLSLTALIVWCIGSYYISHMVKLFAMSRTALSILFAFNLQSVVPKYMFIVLADVEIDQHLAFDILLSIFLFLVCLLEIIQLFDKMNLNDNAKRSIHRTLYPLIYHILWSMALATPNYSVGFSLFSHNVFIAVFTLACTLITLIYHKHYYYLSVGMFAFFSLLICVSLLLRIMLILFFTVTTMVINMVTFAEKY
ncbi:hypothetical protein PCE1_001913 [Barthelona sp. PCE]